MLIVLWMRFWAHLGRSLHICIITRWMPATRTDISVIAIYNSFRCYSFSQILYMVFLFLSHLHTARARLVSPRQAEPCRS